MMINALRKNQHVEQKKPRLLVIDDTVNITRAVQRHFRDSYEIIKAHSLKMATHLIENEFIDIVLMDIVLDHSPRFELIKKVRESMNLASVPIIIITSDERKDVIDQCLDMGCDDIVKKPFQIGDLEDRMWQVRTGKMGNLTDYLQDCSECGQLVTSKARICRYCDNILSNDDEAKKARQGTRLHHLFKAQDERGFVSKRQIEDTNKKLIDILGLSASALNRTEIDTIQFFCRFMRLEYDHRGLVSFMKSNPMVWAKYKALLLKTIFSSNSNPNIDLKDLLKIDFKVLKQLACYVFLDDFLSSWSINFMRGVDQKEFKDYGWYLPMISYHIAPVLGIRNDEGFNLAASFVLSNLFFMKKFQKPIYEIKNTLSVSEMLQDFFYSRNQFYSKVFHPSLFIRAGIKDQLLGFSMRKSLLEKDRKFSYLLALSHLIIDDYFGIKVRKNNQDTSLELQFALENYFDDKNTALAEKLKSKLTLLRGMTSL